MLSLSVVLKAILEILYLGIVLASRIVAASIHAHFQTESQALVWGG